jgi:hypothetical protein
VIFFVAKIRHFANKKKDPKQLGQGNLMKKFQNFCQISKKKDMKLSSFLEDFG